MQLHASRVMLENQQQRIAACAWFGSQDLPKRLFSDFHAAKIVIIVESIAQSA